MMMPAGYENRGSLTADLFLCQYYATTLWTMFISYSHQEVYSYELDDFDEKGKPAKGFARELPADGVRYKVWYRQEGTTGEGKVHIFSNKRPTSEATCEGQPIEQDVIE